MPCRRADYFFIKSSEFDKVVPALNQLIAIEESGSDARNDSDSESSEMISP